MFGSASGADEGPVVGGAVAQHLASAPAIGTFQVVRGLVTVTRGDAVAQPAVGDPIYQGDLIETRSDGQVAIVFVDGTNFHLHADSRLVLDEYICGAEKSSDSALLRVVRGAFGLVAGQMATTGRLMIDTPLGQIRSTAPGVGFGSLAVAILAFALVRESKAHDADPAFLDDGHINYKDLPHGVFEIHTKGDPAHGIPPQVIIVDDPGVTIVIQSRGSGVSVQEVVNSPTQMSQLLTAYQSALSTYQQGQIDPFIQHWQHADVTPQSTGNSGSSTAPSILSENENNNNDNTNQEQTNNNGVTGHTTGSDTGTNTNSTLDIYVLPPPPPTVLPVATIGLEGPPVKGGPVMGGEDSPIPLNLGVTPSNGSSLSIVLVGEIPLGAVLSDGTNTFTATTGDTSVNVASWNLSNLTITEPNDTNFTLSVTAADQSVTGVSASATGTEAVTVNPLAPAVVPGTVTGHGAGTPIPLALGITVNSETGSDGDSPVTNKLYSVMISDIPSGATLSDSNGPLTFTGASITFDATDLADNVLSGLAITPANSTNFTLSIAAIETDAENNLSATATGNEQVIVNPGGPIITASTTIASGAIEEISGKTGDLAVDQASGTITFTDSSSPVDLSSSTLVSAVWTQAGGANAVIADPGELSLGTLSYNTGTGDGSLGWSYKVVDDNLDFLAQGEALTLTYNVTITDENGASANQLVTVTITGTNDAPVLNADTSGPHAITELANTTGSTAADKSSANLTFTDVDLDDTHSVTIGTPAATWSAGPLTGLTSADATALTAALDSAVSYTLTDSTHSGAGSVALAFSAADDAFDFLAKGETLTVVYDVTVTDDNGASSTQPVSFTITGTNDAPVLNADTSGPHAITELANTTGSTAADKSSANLTFTDVDLDDTHSVTIGTPAATWSAGPLTGLTSADATALTAALDSAVSYTLTDSTHSGAGSVALAFSAADDAFDFLAKGETLTVVYDVTVTDDNGASSTQPVSFTITGTNDAPVLNADTSGPHAITELANTTGSTAADKSSANLTFTDVDLDDTHSVTIGTPAATWSAGPLTGLTSADATALTAALDSAVSYTLTDSTHSGAGSVALAFSAADDAFDFLAKGETLTVVYDVTVTDDNGASSTQPVSFTITGTNDAPVLNADTSGPHAITELANTTGSTAADKSSANLTFTDVDLDDTHSVTIGTPAATWSAGPLTGLTSADATALTAALDSAVSYTLTDSTHSGAGSVALAFSAADDAFDFLAKGETLTVVYDVTVTDDNGASSTQPVSFTITGTNDAPVLNADTSGPHAITELANTTGSTAADKSSANLTFTDVDLDDTHSVTIGTPAATWSAGPLTGLTSADATALTAALDSAVSYTLTDSTHSGAGSVALAFSAADDAFDFLAKGETLTVVYDVTVTDDNGASSTQPVSFTITGTNDAPVLNADTSGPHAITELANTTGSTAADKSSANLTFTDVDLDDTHSVTIGTPAATWSAGPLTGLTSADATALTAALDSAVSYTLTDSTHSGAGSVALAFSAADDAFDFLAKGETLTVVYDVTVTDDNGASSTQPVSFTITGTNDAPVLNADTSGPHAITELANTTGSTAADKSSANLTFTDVDLDDTHSVTIGTPAATWSAGPLTGLTSADATALTAALDSAVSYTLTDSTHSGAGSVALAFSAADDAFDFLAKGETLTVVYDVTVTDDNGASSTQPVSFTITGTNDAPVLNADTSGPHAITELANTTGSTAADKSSANLTFTDVDLDDTHSVTIGTPAATWSAGPLTGLTSADATALTAALDSAVSYTLTDSTHSGAGSVALAFSAADDAFDFLAKGETLTVVYDVTVTDDNGASSTQPVSFTITGTNDAPVLNADTSGPHAITELANTTGSTAADKSSANLTFTDVDLDDTHSVTIGTPAATWSAGPLTGLTSADATALTAALDSAVSYTLTDSTHSGAGSVALAFSAADDAFDFLAKGETLTVVYDVTVTDDNGASSTQPVSFTVTGTNDQPVITSAAETGNINEVANTTTTSGTLNFTDVDLDDKHTVSLSTPTLVWSGGTLTTAEQNALTAAMALTASIATDSTNTGSGAVDWNFSLPDTDAGFLTTGQTLKLIYDVTVTDNSGAANAGSAPQTVTVIITGVNGPLVVAVPGAQTFDVNETRAITGVSVSENGNTSGEIFTVTLTDTHGDLSANTSLTGGGGTITGSGTKDLIIQGTLSQVYSDLGTLTDTDGTAGSDTIKVNATDNFGHVASQQTIAVTANAVNETPEPPTLSLGTNFTITEVSGAVTSATLNLHSSVVSNLATYTGTLVSSTPGDLNDGSTDSTIVTTGSDGTTFDLVDSHINGNSFNPLAVTTIVLNDGVVTSINFSGQINGSVVGFGADSINELSSGANTEVIARNQFNEVDADLYLPGSPVTVSGDGTVTLPTITATPVDNDDDLTVTIAGLPMGATITYDGTVHSGSSFTLTEATVGTQFTLNDLTLNDGTNDENFTLVVTATNTTAGESASSASQSIAVTVTPEAPAGAAGSPINLALANPSAANGKTVAITVSGVPSDWQLNEGTNLGNGTWTVQTDDLSALTVMTAAAYAGAMLLNITETWTNADGSTGIATVSDNVEAYATGSPIFAWSGADTLTGAGGNDLFVFAQPIGNDTIYNFNVATDQIDLTGFAGITSFDDLAGHIADASNGDTVITLGAGETITLHSVTAASLTAGDFVFNQTPVVDNAGIMTVSDGAVLPLDGVVDNTGTIALNSGGDATELQIVGAGVMLEGGGQVILSDSSENMIVGTNTDATLTNVDNIISGAGQIGAGDGNLTLINETAGTIDANYADGSLTLDTGNTIINAGLLEATNGGTLHIIDSVSNSGTLAAIGGTIMADGNVTGSGDVIITGGGNADFAGASDQNITFTGPGVLELDHSQSFGGVVSGFGIGNVIDLNDLAYSTNETLAWTQGNGSGVLTIDDNGTTENITLDGNYSQGEFALTNDATPAAGTDVTSVPIVDAMAVSDTSDLTGSISFADSNANDTLNASASPGGAGYAGSFSLDPVTESNGTASVDWGFSLGNDHINLAPGQTLSQSYDVTVADLQNPAENVNQTLSVSIGGPGNDNFVFAPGIGADTIANFNSQHDTIELDGFANAQTVQELQSLITSDVHGNAVIDLGHNDSITLPGMSPAQLQAVLQSTVHLH